MRIPRTLLGFVVLSVLFCSTMIFPAKPISTEARATSRGLKSRSFEFVYRAAIKAGTGVRRLNIWLPYPTSDANQEVSDVQISSPSQMTVYTEPRFGNTILFASIESPKPEPVPIEIKFKVTRTENIRNDFSRALPHRTGPLDPQLEMYSKPDKLVPIDGQIAKWAQEVTRGKETDLEKARAVYDYAIATLKYDKSGRGWGRGDIYYACDAKRGNCTDFHAVFIGFCRALGIPARFAIGFPLPEKRGDGEIGGYHCWAEFYLAGYGWVPVDASEAWKQPERRNYFFGAHDENRVQFTMGRDIVLRPRQRGDPLNYFIYPYAEADGKPITTVDRKFSFRDL